MVFQFNPEQLTRNRSLTFSVPGESGQTARQDRLYHTEADLLTIQETHKVDVAEEKISFDHACGQAGEFRPALQSHRRRPGNRPATAGREFGEPSRHDPLPDRPMRTGA